MSQGAEFWRKSADSGEAEDTTDLQLGSLRDIYSMKAIVAVTSGYHVPRVILTAAKLLPNANVFVVSVPYDEDWDYDVAEMCAGEIWRILKYSAKSDIADPSMLWMPAQLLPGG